MWCLTLCPPKNCPGRVRVPRRRLRGLAQRTDRTSVATLMRGSWETVNVIINRRVARSATPAEQVSDPGRRRGRDPLVPLAQRPVRTYGMRCSRQSVAAAWWITRFSPGCAGDWRTSVRRVAPPLAAELDWETRMKRRIWGDSVAVGTQTVDRTDSGDDQSASSRRGQWRRPSRTTRDDRVRIEAAVANIQIQGARYTVQQLEAIDL